jgi:hypothetical protein
MGEWRRRSVQSLLSLLGGSAHQRAACRVPEPRRVEEQLATRAVGDGALRVVVCKGCKCRGGRRLRVAERERESRTSQHPAQPFAREGIE